MVLGAKIVSERHDLCWESWRFNLISIFEFLEAAALSVWLFAVKWKGKRLMKSLLALVLILAFTSAKYDGEGKDRECERKKLFDPRPHSVSLLEFGAVGDGKTLNTVAFQNAIFYVKSFADKGGAQLYVPPGRWLTGSFNLTSHLTLFLEAGAIILGSQDYAHWEIVEPLPSYGRGIDFPGWRYRSLINGDNLTDVMITGDNGTIDGQGFVWWEQFSYHALNYSRPHLVEFTGCENVTVSNLTLLNSPAWHIHPTYCRNVQVLNITLHASPASPYTSGIVPDSSEHVCIENCNISMGHDAIVLKSGWDEYGIAFAKPTKNVHIRGVNLQSSLGSGLAFGSEMSGGISNVRVEQLRLHNSFIGIALKTAMGRGGYMKDIVISNVEMENIRLAIEATGQIGLHPDEKYDPDELPVVRGITFENMVATNVTLAGNFSGLEKSPFTSICLSNISFALTWNSSTSWFCSNVIGFSQEVSPQPCSNLRDSALNSSSACFFPLYNYASVL